MGISPPAEGSTSLGKRVRADEIDNVDFARESRSTRSGSGVEERQAGLERRIAGERGWSWNGSGSSWGSRGGGGILLGRLKGGGGSYGEGGQDGARTRAATAVFGTALCARLDSATGTASVVSPGRDQRVLTWSTLRIPVLSHTSTLCTRSYPTDLLLPQMPRLHTAPPFLLPPTPRLSPPRTTSRTTTLDPCPCPSRPLDLRRSVEVRTLELRSKPSLTPRLCAALPHEKLYLDHLPSADRYWKSFMHRDTVTEIAVTSSVPPSSFVLPC